MQAMHEMEGIGMCEDTPNPTQCELKKRGDDNEIFGTILLYNNNYHLK